MLKQGDDQGGQGDDQEGALGMRVEELQHDDGPGRRPSLVACA